MARPPGDVRAREVVSGIYGPLLYVAKSTRRRSQTKIARDAIEVDMHAQNKRAEEIPSLCTSGLWELGASRKLHWQTGRAQAPGHDTLDTLHRLPLRSVVCNWMAQGAWERPRRPSVRQLWMDGSAGETRREESGRGRDRNTEGRRGCCGHRWERARAIGTPQLCGRRDVFDFRPWVLCLDPLLLTPDSDSVGR